MDTLCFYKDGISEDIAKALHHLGYHTPTIVQARVIPYAMEKKDLIVKAKTGSGKTAAYAIPICELIEWLENKPQALILTPTRELAVQVQEDVINIGRLKRIKAAAIYGRHPFSIEKAELKQKTHVVAGTPGRVLDHINKGTLPLNKIKYLVIDEADRMLQMGFIEQVEAIIKELQCDRITMLFSATMPDEVLKIASTYMREPIQIDGNETDVDTADIDHFLYHTREEDKFELLTDVTIMEQPDRCIIFCSTKDRVDILSSRLLKLNYSCEKIHGKMEQRDRLSAMMRFKKGKCRYLIATDVAARGIDVDLVSLVINYDLPINKETYVHRTGRTGRAGHKGKAISFVEPAQSGYLHNIEELIGVQIQELERPDKEKVAIQTPAFYEKMNSAIEMKKEKTDQLQKDIMKLRFSGGKKKKLRATNFVGVLSNLEGIEAEDIGIIAILDTLTYIDILNGKGPLVLEAMKTTKICGKQLKVTEAVDKR